MADEFITWSTNDYSLKTRNSAPLAKAAGESERGCDALHLIETMASFNSLYEDLYFLRRTSFFPHLRPRQRRSSST
ncbi:hypothetical protein RRG08_055286 [Elysia crispata]|uniref:Uncharacterized protein n=1 Tax=Elysia crispata TaxID=231223 RepID=A0AAE1E231_9GAST|nr:hypothetical protein RRG08_055286 [Elysia crispata]